MNNVFLHSKNDSKKILLKYILLLIPFLIFGFYKNGIKLYSLHLINFINIFNPLFLFIIAITISIITSLIFKEKILSYKLISNIIISLIVMPNINFIIYSILLLILNIVYHFMPFNLSCLFMIIVSLFLIINNSYSYANIYEIDKVFHFTFADFLTGKAIGGVGNTLLIATIIAFIILMTSWCYKKTIVLSSFITFYFLYVSYCFISSNFQLTYFASPTLLFSFIFISPLSIYSPYTKAGCLIYGLLLGILCFIATFWNFELGIYISIFILSIFSTLTDKLFTKKANNQLIETL